MEEQEFNGQEPSLDQTEAEQVSELPEKFSFGGKTWTRDEFESSTMRHADYTRKTQELAEQRSVYEKYKDWDKYSDNLYADVENVRRNPQLAAKFMEVYPKQFHKFIEQFRQQEQPGNVPPELKSELDNIKSFIQTQQEEKAMAAIDNAFAKYQSKYPLAVEPLVLSLAQTKDAQGIKLTDSEWEKTFKQAHAILEKQTKTHYGDLVKRQSSASKQAADVTKGGDAMGHAPVVPKTIKEATRIALEDAKRGVGAFARN